MRDAVSALYNDVMQEGVHYMRANGKPVLLKPGAELIMIELSLTYRSRVISARNKTGEYIVETEMFRDQRSLGNGLGYSSVTDDHVDRNAALKIARKRSFVDAILSVTGASAIFTQDIGENAPATEKQLAYIRYLASSPEMAPGILDALMEAFEIESMERMTRSQASEIIDALLSFLRKDGGK